MSEYKEPYVSDVREEGDGTIVEEIVAPQPRDKSSDVESKADARTAPTRNAPVGLNEVSPEFIAVISERIKAEVIQALAQQPLHVHTNSTTYSAHGSHSPHTSDATTPPNGRAHTPPSPALPSRQRHFSPPAQRPISPHSDTSASVSSMGREDKPRHVNRMNAEENASQQARPTRSGRIFSNADMSTIDQKWGVLFDQNMQPTSRLGQILRGIANHLVDDFDPRRSIVIPPSKMAEFYTRYSLDKELHPYSAIFASERHDDISRLYRTLHCEHHLIQSGSLSAAPSMPALTPNGFANWCTLMIVSDPDIEHTRLEHLVLAIPIDADGVLLENKPERLPKQMSRHLLPRSSDESRRDEVRSAIKVFLDATTERKRSQPQPSASVPTAVPRTVETMPSSIAQPIFERERQPYVKSVQEAAIEDDSPPPSGQRPERERESYPLGVSESKVYTSNDGGNLAPATSASFRADRTTSRPVRRETEDFSIPRRESRAARDYVPSTRPMSMYRQPSPGPSNPARSDLPVRPNAGRDERDVRYNAKNTFSDLPVASPVSGHYSSSLSTEALPPPHKSLTLEPPPRERRRDRRTSDTESAGTRPRYRSTSRDPERERERDRERDRERERAYEREKAEARTTMRTRRDTFNTTRERERDRERGSSKYDDDDVKYKEPERLVRYEDGSYPRNY